MLERVIETFRVSSPRPVASLFRISFLSTTEAVTPNGGLCVLRVVLMRLARDSSVSSEWTSMRSLRPPMLIQK